MDVDAETTKRSDDERGPSKPRGDRERRDSVRERERDRERDRERRERSPRRRSDHWDGDERRNDRRSPRRRDRSRSRSRSRSRRRSPSPSRRRRGGGGGGGGPGRSRSRSPVRGGGGAGAGAGTSSSRRDEPFARSLGGPMNADHAEAVEFAKQSKRENRIYVGNLSYDVRYRDLIEFMRGAGEVLFAEVLITPTGQSKGCGLVEFATQEEAKNAISNLSESQLMGRPIFIREDREDESRFGQTPVPGKIGAAMAANGTSVPPPRPTYHGGPFRPTSSGFPPSMGTNPGNQLYVGNLPYQAGWQDIKDLFRHSGSVVRADINVGIDGRAKGSGTVVFETAKDAQNAINMYNGFEWYGRVLEVREDRFAGLYGPSRGRGLPRGSSFSGRGGFGGGGGGGGGFRGRGGGGGGGGRSTGNLYGDYTGPDGASSGNGFPGGPNGEVVPVQQILVTNLPWSTANEDLVELFETTGHVQQAEILYEGNRSKGMGIVQFEQIDEAETAIAKFTSYMYGGRPLGVQFNPTWHNFSPSAAKGGAA